MRNDVEREEVTEAVAVVSKKQAEELAYTLEEGRDTRAAGEVELRFDGQARKASRDRFNSIDDLTALIMDTFDVGTVADLEILIGEQGSEPREFKPLVDVQKVGDGDVIDVRRKEQAYSCAGEDGPESKKNSKKTPAINEEDNVEAAVDAEPAFHIDNQGSTIVETPPAELPRVNTPSRHVVRIRGVPFNCSIQDLEQFFRNDPKPLQVHIMKNESGRLLGDCYVEFASAQETSLAMKYDRCYLGSRYLELFQATGVELEAALQRLRGRGPLAGTCVRLRGLPFNCSQQDVIVFFQAVGVTPIAVRIRDDWKDGFAEFRTDHEATIAMARDNNHLGHRYIELSRVPNDEMHRTTRRWHSFATERTLPSSNAPPTFALNGITYEHYARASAPGGYGRLTPAAPYPVAGVGFSAPGHPYAPVPTPYPRPNVYGTPYAQYVPPAANVPPNAVAAPAACFYSFGNAVPPQYLPLSSPGVFGGMGSQSQLMQRPLPSGGISRIKLKGIPWGSTAGDILQFFHGYNPIEQSVFLVQNERGQLSGEAFVDFASPADASRALQEKNCKYMGNRYIALYLENH